MSTTPGLQHDDDGVVIRIPMKVRRRSGRKAIVVPEGLPEPGAPKASQYGHLVLLLARAHYWQELLDSGRFATITDLAKALDLDRGYISRVLQLSLLAPDITEAILRGDEPEGISCTKLRAPIPALWAEQRRVLGCPGPTEKAATRAAFPNPSGGS